MTRLVLGMFLTEYNEAEAMRLFKPEGKKKESELCIGNKA